MPRFKTDQLTPQQERFITELLQDGAFNVSKAAEAAGYSTPNVAGWKLMRKPHVQSALAKALQAREERAELKADDVLDYLRQALFLNPFRLFQPGEDGTWTIRNLDDIPEEVGRLIESIEFKHDSFKVKLIGKGRCLELSMKHLGLLTDKLEIEGQGGGWFDVMFDTQAIHGRIGDALKALEAGDVESAREALEASPSRRLFERSDEPCPIEARLLAEAAKGAP